MKKYKAIESSFISELCILKPGNFSDPRKIAFVTGHLLLIFQIVNVDFIFLEYKLTVNVHLCIRLT